MVPKLRFSEFNMPWKQTTLGSVSSYAAYGMNSSAIEFDGVNKYIRITDIDDDTREFIPSPLTTPSGKLENQYLLNKGDIVFARTGASVGKSYLYKQKDGRLYFAGFLIKLTINKANPYFVYNQTLTEKYRKWIKVYSMRSGQPGINAEEYKEFEFAIPSLEEQTRIADFLSSVDERITLLNKQYDLLCRYKKGMMQKIFSQEVRFKDNHGRSFPKWTMRKFSDFFTIGSSKRVLQDDWVNEGVPFYRTRELVSLSKKEKFKSEIFITEDNYTYLKDKYGVPAVGDFLVSGVGTLGIIHQVRNDNPFYFKDGNVLWFKKNNEINSDFFYHVFNSSKVLTQIVNHAAITTVGTYTIENAKKTKFMYPSLEEQNKIANLLSAMDDKITIKKTELDKLKTWKQGLLQQMFV
ncbi:MULTISPECIES: restriction endonuclease subunit S [Enterobacterales]|uniref:Type I restriction modification DNA specificity domain-containing protein n=2 Tax=Enterobacterales TaxID=91347 RepID=A0A6P1Q459_9GAMM|nr:MULTISPECIES: restriction endonuclease subunit S [Enterobacterales]MBY6251080.1 restriction endonuclease subunit S [Citrobacter werkmanii]QHM73766.1 hypothetical protein C7M51_04124 [Mixta intestinalis]